GPVTGGRAGAGPLNFPSSTVRCGPPGTRPGGPRRSAFPSWPGVLVTQGVAAVGLRAHADAGGGEAAGEGDRRRGRVDGSVPAGAQLTAAVVAPGQDLAVRGAGKGGQAVGPQGGHLCAPGQHKGPWVVRLPGGDAGEIAVRVVAPAEQGARR